MNDHPETLEPAEAADEGVTAQSVGQSQSPANAWPGPPVPAPMVCDPDVVILRNPTGAAVVLGVFTTGGSLFCAMPPAQAMALGKALRTAATNAAEPGLQVPAKRLIVPRA